MLQSMGSQRVGHDRAKLNKLSNHSCSDQWVPGNGKECIFSSLQLLVLQKKNKKDFSYSSRKQNDLGVPGSFPKTSYKSQTLLLVSRIPESLSLKFLVKSRWKEFCQETSVKGLPFTIHVHFQTAHREVKGCSQQWKYTHVARHAGFVQEAPV